MSQRGPLLFKQPQTSSLQPTVSIKWPLTFSAVVGSTNNWFQFFRRYFYYHILNVQGCSLWHYYTCIWYTLLIYSSSITPLVSCLFPPISHMWEKTFLFLWDWLNSLNTIVFSCICFSKLKIVLLSFFPFSFSRVDFSRTSQRYGSQ